jgi:4-hydroxy-tetrahydrodipicolinate reductase
MKIALLGYGKMGRMVEEAALKKGHTIIAKISSHESSQITSSTPSSIEHADVCIDFSHPSCVIDNIKKAAQLKKNLIVGTTGWDDHLDFVKKIVKQHQIGFMYAPNFSLGVHLFRRIVAEAATLINAFEEYDIGVIEAHHNKKADSPSGTALSIANVLLERIQRKKRLVYDADQEPVVPEDIHVASIRCGTIPGTHEVVLDSRVDTITLKHVARSREGFAEGAVTAAEWLEGKSGFYTIDDLFT